MTTHEQAPMTPEEVQAKMIALHHELSNFLFYLTMNSKTIPPVANQEDYDAITYVQELLERETRRMGQVIQERNKQRNLDTLVENSLKAAGFEPDKPKEEPPANASN